MGIDKKKLDNIIETVSDVLEENKDNPDVKEAYEKMKELKAKRNIK